MSGGQLGRFALLGPLGHGASADVFAADDGGRRVAIKRVRGPARHDALVAEVAAAARLRHPHIAPVLELGEHEGELFVVMALVEGVAAAQLATPVEPLAVMQLGADVAAALHHVHLARDAQGRRLGLVHGDVSAHNVLVEPKGSAVLIDLGLAALRAEGALGTLATLAPERLDGAPASPLTDQFSLGVILWELATGRPLFDGDSDVEVLRAVESRAIDPPGTVQPRAQPLDGVVAQMLCREPGGRFATCGAVAQALELELTGRPGRRALAAAAAPTPGP